MSSEPNLTAPSPVERVSLLEADHVRLTRCLTQVHEVIADMERLDSLTPDAAAALAMYRESETRMTLERARIEFETGRLLSREPEAVLEWDRLHVDDPDRAEAETVDELQRVE
jgi:hypothetical protein